MDHVQFFKCLSDETRLSIVLLIAQNKEQCVCDLTDKLQLSQPKNFTSSGLVTFLWFTQRSPAKPVGVLQH